MKSIKNRTKTNDKSDNHELLETVRGKLTQSAGIWFDNNEASFKKWSDFDEIVDLGREIDPQMSHPTIIRYLISGLTPDFQKELSRRESAMNTLNEFLKYAKIEQDLNDTFDKLGEISINQQPQFDFNRPLHTATTSTVNTRKHDFRNDKRNYQAQQSFNKQSSDLERNLNTRRVGPTQPSSDSTRRTFPRRNWQAQKPLTSQANTSRQNLNCKVCGRKNHRTIDCFHKKKSGCFKCGEDHMIRDCKMLTNFQ